MLAKFFRNTQNILFIFTQDRTGDFWVWDQTRYHRFVWKESCVRYVRSQMFLPPGAVGSCLAVSDMERWMLLREAGRHNLQLAFFENEETCLQSLQDEARNLYIFDCTAPTDYFWLDDDISRQDKA